MTIFGVTEVRGATIRPTGNGNASRCMDVEAYNNRLLITVENLLTSITEDMPSRPQLLYFFAVMDYHLLEGHKPAPVPEMILNVRFRLQLGPEEGARVIAQIQKRLGIVTIPYRAGWLINNIRMKFLGRQARRSDSPHSVFHCHTGVDRSIPYLTAQGIRIHMGVGSHPRIQVWRSRTAKRRIT